MTRRQQMRMPPPSPQPAVSRIPTENYRSVRGSPVPMVSRQPVVSSEHKVNEQENVVGGSSSSGSSKEGVRSMSTPSTARLNAALREFEMANNSPITEENHDSPISEQDQQREAARERDPRDEEVVARGRANMSVDEMLRADDGAEETHRARGGVRGT